MAPDGAHIVGCRCRSLFKLFTYPVLIAYVRDARTYIPYHGRYHMDTLMRYRRPLPRMRIVVCSFVHNLVTPVRHVHNEHDLRTFRHAAIATSVLVHVDPTRDNFTHMCAHVYLASMARLASGTRALCSMKVLFQTQADITFVSV